MSPEVPAESKRESKREHSGWSRVLVIILAVILALLIVLSLGRNYIASRVAEFYLARKGIASEIDISQFDWGAIDARVRLGPSLAPDLTIERLHIWLGGDHFVPDIESIEMTEPRLRIHFDGKQVSFGALDRLLAVFTKSSAAEPGGTAGGAVPPPRKPLGISFENARLTIETPAGNVVAAGTGAFIGTQIRNLRASIQPAQLRSRHFTADILAGRIEGRANGKTSNLEIALGAKRIAYQGKWHVSTLSGSVRLQRATWQNARFTAASMALRLNTQDAETPDAAAKTAQLSLKASDVRGNALRGTLDVTMASDVNLTASEARLDQSRAKKLVVNAHSGAAQLGYANSGWGISGPLALHVNLAAANTVASGHGISAARADVQMKGTGGWINGTASADLTGTITAEGGITNGRSLARQIPLAGSDPATVRAITRALTRFTADAPDLHLTYMPERKAITVKVPSILKSASGATIRFAPNGEAGFVEGENGRWRGAFTLETQGGGLPVIALNMADFALRTDQAAMPLEAALHLRLKANWQTFHGITLDTMGRLSGASGVLHFVPEGCAAVGLDHYESGGKPMVSALKSQFCAADAQPLLTTDHGQWKVAGRWNNAKLRLDRTTANAMSATGRLAISGNQAGMENGAAQSNAITLTDTASAKRFAPMAVRMKAALVHGTWRGTAHIAAKETRTNIASVAFHHNMKTSVGGATVAAQDIAFAPDKLQPENLSPLLAKLTRAKGSADFTGQVSWTANAQKSQGTLRADGLDVTGPLGAMRDVKLHIDFTSLLPMLTAPAQSFSAASADWLLPLSNIQANFRLMADGIHLNSASALTGGGEISLSSLTLPYGPGSTMTGTVELAHVNLNALIAASNLQDKVTLDVPVTGTIPFSLGPAGIRLHNGQLQSDNQGRLAIPRSVWTGANAGPPDALHDLAYQAMENLSIDEMDAVLNSLPNGRLGILFHVKGRNDPAVGQEARIGLIPLVRGEVLQEPLPLPKGTPVNLTLDTSLNFDELLHAYQGVFGGGPSAQGAGK